MKVGDYIRTKKGTLQPPQIARIKSMQKDSGYHNLYYIELDHNLIPYYNFHIYTDDIDKSSPDIIDLIQVGDYVNGGQVREIKKGYIRISGGKSIWEYLDNLKDIKTIVTKEQFESIEYKIGE